MKKLFAALLTCALLLAAVPALGETDPIVGVWYVYFNTDTSMILGAYVFDAQGGITMLGLTVDENGYRDTSLFEYKNAGSWIKLNGDGLYIISSKLTIAGLSVLRGDSLYIPNSDGGAMLYRRLANYDGPQLVFNLQEYSDLMKQGS